jgi:PilZ domain
MKERRQYERFNIPLSVRLETIEAERKEILDNETKDISASGTFIPSHSSLPEGTRFILDFTIPSDDIKEFKYVKSLRGSTGTLVRSNSKGIAVHFDRDCYIVSLNSNNMN